MSHRWHSGDGCEMASTLREYDLRKGATSVVHRDNRCVYMTHTYFYVRCSDCVGVCGNVCCVAGVDKYSGL